MQSINRIFNPLFVQSNRYLLIFLVLFLLPISGLSTDIFVPSLPALKLDFATQQSLVQLTITAYMLGLGIMQFFAGPISDSFGRRKPFLGSMLFYIITSLWIPFSHSIYEIVVLRALQGAAVAISVVPLRAIVADLFKGHEFQKISNTVALAWSIGPIIAPFIGGYLQHYFGWQACFYALTIYSAIGFIAIFLLMPETSAHRHSFHWISIAKRYREILTHKKYLAAVIMNGLLYSMVILFSVIVPFLTKSLLHYNAIQFGHLALLIGVAWALGSIVNRFMIHWDSRKKVTLFLSAMLILNVIQLLYLFLFPFHITIFMTLNFIFFFFGAIVLTNNFSFALALFPHANGSANALFGAFVFLIPTGISLLGTLLKTSSALPMTFAFFIIVILCLTFSTLLKKGPAHAI
ncbi:MAG: hypothetical protein A3F10_06905 [Coxiella sp. RIFCSPHIGHO2_12_FULL_42_15]|nr:MAG: hypothetical protein A3F10_06905 [Coxiella sp. RIFCSPHIGHO2_12_FULL_42_15]